MQDAGSSSSSSSRKRQREEMLMKREAAMRLKREILTAQGKCLNGSYLFPYCTCSEENLTCCRPKPVSGNVKRVLPALQAYRRQLRQSHCFDIDDCPASPFSGVACRDASIHPLAPSMDFNNKSNLPMELANLAIHQHNTKECPVCHNTKNCHFTSQLSKYEVLKIEKASFSLQGTSYQYWMTVKVLNLTLATPIETFLVHAGLNFIHDEISIYCSRPKEEAIVGLPSCHVCNGKLRSEEDQLDPEGVVRKGDLPDKFLVDLCWNDENFIPKGALKEHREAFQRIYRRYFRQIFQSDGFDLDVYPGDAKEAIYIPYLDFEKEADMLMELANHAIQDFNKTNAYKYKVSYIEKVNFLMANYREFFMTVKVVNMTLHAPLETFQIHAYKGPGEENVARLCRKKVLI